MKTKEEFKAFMNYAAIARNRFVNKVNEQDWNRELREESENILIAYDQLRERLEEYAKEVNDDWIEIEKNPPEFDEWVLLFNGHWIGVGKLWKLEEDLDEDECPQYCDETNEFIFPDPTHWKKLPPQPTKLKDNE